jgi:hypothetical protein
MSPRTAHTTHYVAERAIPSVVDMTQTQNSTTPDTCSGRRGSDRTLALVTTGSAGLAYLAWRAGGVHLTVKSGEGAFQVGLVSVLVTAAVVSVAGLGLLRFLERRDARGLQAWTLLACFVWVASLLGPLGATDLSSGLALASLHLVVGSAVVVGARRMRRRGVA